ncbi:MAG: MFS transporter [Deltaproteobacteria bacterium]|nr:MFS transporter [Deltaproteobacteria bacterium]
MAWPVRHKLVGLLAVGSAINYADRVNISVAAPSMMATLGWDEARFGLIFSAFLVGYGLLQIPGGVLADRWGAKYVIASACVGFSLFTALTPLGSLAFGLMLALRFSVGLFESVTFPAYASLNSRWIPRAEYSRAQTLSLSGVYIGQTLSYPITTWIVLTFSWPSAFYFNAALGGLWLIAWLAYAANTPAAHPKVTEAELRHIEAGLSSRSDSNPSLWSVLKQPQVLFLSLAYLCLVYGLWMIVFWLPTYLVKGRGFSMHAMGWLGMIPTFASFVGLIGGGFLSDALLRSGVSTRFARAQGPALCIAAAIPFLIAAALVPWAGVSIACLTLYLMLANAAGGGFWSVPRELDPQQVGVISGVMNCAGNLAGIFGPLSAGFFVSGSGSWAVPFLVAAGVASISFLVFYFLVVPAPLREETPFPRTVPHEARG